MFDRIFADYLVEMGKLSEQNVEVIFSTKEERRARLGVIAVSQKMLSVEQAEEINQLQAVYDKRFGDIAIDNGFLTPEQVTRLLDLQGNDFLTFVQAVVDHGCLSIEELNASLDKYQETYSLTLSDMENLKSCAIENIVPIFLYKQPDLLITLFGVLLRTLYRLVDHRIFIRRPYTVSKLDYSYISIQELFGDHSILNAICGNIDALKEVAVNFAGSAFIDDEEDCLDALCELINCANGMFASKAVDDINLDMHVPKYFTTAGSIKADSLLCIPLVINNHEFTVVMSLDTTYTI